MDTTDNTDPPDLKSSLSSPNSGKADVVLYIDGKISVEHQLDIHVNDLLQAELGRGPTVLDILNGIRYVMDYRIRNGRLPHLDYDLCCRLLQAFLKFAPQRIHQGGALFYSKK